MTPISLSLKDVRHSPSTIGPLGKQSFEAGDGSHDCRLSLEPRLASFQFQFPKDVKEQEVVVYVSLYLDTNLSVRNDRPVTTVSHCFSLQPIPSETSLVGAEASKSAQQQTLSNEMENVRSTEVKWTYGGHDMAAMSLYPVWFDPEMQRALPKLRGTFG